MGLMQKLGRKLSGTRAESGVRSNSTPRNYNGAGDRDGMHNMNDRGPVRNPAFNNAADTNFQRPQYTTRPSATSSNSFSSQLCDVVVHCATVMPRTNTNTSSLNSNDAQQNGFNLNFDGQNNGNYGGSQQRNGQRDTIMPLHTDNDSYRAGYEAGRLYKPQSVPSSLHSSRPGTGGFRNDTLHSTPSCENCQPGHMRNNHNMNLSHSHAGAFNQQQHSWNQSGPSTDSSQISQGRNTFGMERGAYDAGYRDALAQVQRSLE